MELGSCHHSDAMNFSVASRFLEICAPFICVIMDSNVLISFILQRLCNYILNGTKPNKHNCVLVASVQRIQHGSTPDYSPTDSGFEPSAVCPAEE